MTRWLVLVLLLGCGQDKRHAEHVLAAIERLREGEPSDPAAREPNVAALEAMTSDVPVAEKARAACATAFRALSSAQALVQRTKDDPARAHLDEALEQVKKARTAIEDCSSATGELRRWLKLH